jgi:sigma-B regulation protein RsbU (phosphoserine phosphatase)
MIRAVLVDDEPPARVRMRQLLDAVGGVTVVGEAGSAVEARAVIRDTRPDVLFLDIEMPEVRGTALAASLPEPRPFIVFATAYDRYGLDAIAVEATDYLLKPVSRARLAATLDRVRGRLAGKNVEKDVAAGAAVQAGMWPVALPAIPGFESAAASLPARGVGGDFFDLFLIQGAQGALGAQGAWGILLGDASGKGVAAGLVASAVQARVHTAARLAHLDAQALMAAVDRDVYATTDGARYATAVYGVLAPATGAMTMVNAGHLPVLLLPHGAGEAVPVHATGPALGLIDAGTFESQSVTLTPGTVMLAYTDGVVDALDAGGDEFGGERLARLLAATRHLPAPHICTAILDAVRAHRGTQQDQDDVTVMAIKAMRL